LNQSDTWSDILSLKALVVAYQGVNVIKKQTEIEEYDFTLKFDI